MGEVTRSPGVRGQGSGVAGLPTGSQPYLLPASMDTPQGITIHGRFTIMNGISVLVELLPVMFRTIAIIQCPLSKWCCLAPL